MYESERIDCSETSIQRFGFAAPCACFDPAQRGENSVVAKVNDGKCRGQGYSLFLPLAEIDAG